MANRTVSFITDSTTYDMDAIWSLGWSKDFLELTQPWSRAMDGWARPQTEASTASSPQGRTFNLSFEEMTYSDADNLRDLFEEVLGAESFTMREYLPGGGYNGYTVIFDGGLRIDRLAGGIYYNATLTLKQV